MRTQKSAKNMIAGFLSQAILIILGFVSRKVMIDSVGVDYLGINGLMNNILIILSLAESGIGAAILYALYKPLANNDIQEIKALMNFYKNIYRILAAFTTLVGLAILPFLKYLIKDNSVDNILVIYLLFLFSSVSSYLFSYKVSINNADQNKYLYTIANTVTQIVVLILKIVILKITNNYILFLAIDIFATITKNIIFSNIVDKRYPYLKEKNDVKLSDDTKKELMKNIKALFIGKVGYIISTSSDNLVISSMINIKTVGLYSNYTTLTSSVYGFVSIFINSISASVGNLIAKESEEKIYEVFNITSFINFWLYAFSFVSLYCLADPFIALWLGNEYILNKAVLFVIMFNFLLDGLLEPIGSVKNAAGIYYPDRYVPAISAVFNLGLSLILVKHIGLTGVFLATILSKLFFTFWINPMLVFRIVFKKSSSIYFIKIILKIMFIFILTFICNFIGEYFYYEYNIINFVCKLIICLLIPNLLLLLISFNKKEFKYVIDIFKPILKGLKLN